MKKGNSPLINGIILGVVFLYLIWYFTTNNMWNPATVIVLILIGLLSAGQFIIWFMFFRNPKKNKRK